MGRTAYLPTLRIPKDPPMEGWTNLYSRGVLVLKIAYFEGVRILRVHETNSSKLKHWGWFRWVSFWGICGLLAQSWGWWFRTPAKNCWVVGVFIPWFWESTKRILKDVRAKLPNNPQQNIPAKMSIWRCLFRFVMSYFYRSPAMNHSIEFFSVPSLKLTVRPWT